MRRIHLGLLSLLAGTISLAQNRSQEGTPTGILRGDLIAWSGTARTGTLTFRGTDDRVFLCVYNQRTYFERARERIAPAALHPGDRLEVVADKQEDSATCYARTVQVLDFPPPRTLPGQRPRLRTSPGATESFAPRGNLTFTGVVMESSSGELILRTRSNERKLILLRQDTRYMGDGQILERANLRVNTRVFVRAGRNIEEELEAYQVVWGDILRP